MRNIPGERNERFIIRFRSGMAGESPFSTIEKRA
jgi:hypothetical protein